MAPLEDLKARDLAWISDFVMQQTVLMMRPMFDQLQETDAAVDYTQRSVQQLSTDVSEVRVDLDRTNRHLALLRQGLAVQNEGRCVLQRSIETTTRTVKRLDEQMEGTLKHCRGVEERMSSLCADSRGFSAKLESIASRTTDLESLRAKLEKVSSETFTLKDYLSNSEARFEVWQRELRDLRRSQLGVPSKLEEKNVRVPSSQRGKGTDSWPSRKSLEQTDDVAKRSGRVPSAGRSMQHTGGSIAEGFGSSAGSRAGTATWIDEPAEPARLPLLPKACSRTEGYAARLRLAETKSPARGTELQ